MTVQNSYKREITSSPTRGMWIEITVEQILYTEVFKVIPHTGDVD